MGTSITFGGTNNALEETTTNNVLQEKVSEQDESDSQKGGEPLPGWGRYDGLTEKQRRTHEKHFIYEKTWSRMNRIINGNKSH